MCMHVWFVGSIIKEEEGSLMHILIAWKQDTMSISIFKQKKFIVFQMDMKSMIHHWMIFDMFWTQGTTSLLHQPLVFYKVHVHTWVMLGHTYVYQIGGVVYKASLLIFLVMLCYTLYTLLWVHANIYTSWSKYFPIFISCRFTKEQVEQLDKNKQWSRALDGSDYLPGMVYFRALVVEPINLF